jgi:hypothetical protein
MIATEIKKKRKRFINVKLIKNVDGITYEKVPQTKKRSNR